MTTYFVLVEIADYEAGCEDLRWAAQELRGLGFEETVTTDKGAIRLPFMLFVNERAVESATEICDKVEKVRRGIIEELGARMIVIQPNSFSILSD